MCNRRKSGRDEDKLAAAEVAFTDGLKVAAPILTDCPVNIECSVVGSVVTGSHEMFIGKIEYVHADTKIVGPDGAIYWGSIEFLGV